MLGKHLLKFQELGVEFHRGRGWLLVFVHEEEIRYLLALLNLANARFCQDWG